MDAKGIAWVGRLYQKFETMCLEVEDIICQDTVKYVENQVEVVGASVKRFYSDVMQDLIPQSELNDQKVAVCNSALEKYENVVVCKKPVKGMKIARSKSVEEKSTDKSKVTAKSDIVHKLPFGDNRANDMSLVSSPYSANRSEINGYSRKKDNENIHHKLDIVDRESAMKGCKYLNEASTNLEMKFVNEASPCAAISNRKCEPSSDTLTVNDVWRDSAEQSSNETETEFVTISSEGSSKSIGDNEKETRVNLSYGDSSAELDGSSDSWSLDEIEHDAIILENGTDKIQQVDEMKLDEACVLVTGDDFHIDCNDEVKHRTYKKKLSGAFSFTKKAMRKQEYKELAVKHCYGFGTTSNRKYEPEQLAEDVSEYDWQLL